MATITPERHVWLELRVLREKDGHSLSSLAREVGMSLGYLSDLENGKREPSAAITKRLAVTLAVPVSVLQKDSGRVTAASQWMAS